MMYNIDNCKISLDGKEITGFASGDFVSYPVYRLWYKDIEGRPFSVYATCDDGHVVEVAFTEDGYEKWIKPMQPTEKSPFKVKEVLNEKV